MEYSKYADPPPTKPFAQHAHEPPLSKNIPPQPTEPLPPVVDREPDPFNDDESIPNQYQPQQSSIEEFAQTRPPDDLFADDFTPMAEPVVEQPPAPPIPNGSRASRAPRNPYPRGGRGPFNNRPMNSHQNTSSDSSTDNRPVQNNTSAPPLPNRHTTGAAPRAKLSEAELIARMEAIKLKNTRLEAAHARSQADEASFREREQEAAARRQIERENRAAMMGERERNRARKLKGSEAREWDLGKEEKVEDTRGGLRRGAYGGVVGGMRGASGAVDEAGDVGEEERSVTAGLRGGFRDRRRGRARGRGGRGGHDRGAPVVEQRQKQQAVPTQDDFPALETATNKEKDWHEKRNDAEPTTSAVPAKENTAKSQKSNWAEEMAESPATPSLS